MGWTTPITWTVSQIVGASDLNSQVRDNLTYLLSGRAKTVIVRDNAASYGVTSTTFVDVDPTNLSITLTPQSGIVEIGFAGAGGYSSTSQVAFDVDIDGTRYANGFGDGITALLGANGPIGFTVTKTGLSIASHTFKLQWKVINGTGSGSLYAGSGTPGSDFAAIFWVREIG